MKEETFRRRYFVKIASSVVIAALNILIQMILPRAFSVEEYGYYSYNLNVFTSVVVLANLSTASAMVAKFSKRNDEIGLVYFYWKFYSLEILILTLGLCVLYPTAFMQESLAGQTIFMAILGLEAAAVNRLLCDIISIFDSMAIVSVTAKFQILLKIIVSTLVVALYMLSSLDLTIFYLVQIGVTLIISLILIHIAVNYQKSKYSQQKIQSFREYASEYASFCSPLVLSSVVAQFITILMNWCLMKFSGATEQALFGAAWQLNTLVNYAFSPYAELSKREYAIYADDIETVGIFYENSLKRIIWLTAYFACFIGFCSDWILGIVYGDEYAGADLVTLMIMIYTVYQAFGQMSGSFMLGTERTKMSAAITMMNQLITFALVFLFQIPNPIFKDSLGANGIGLVYMLGAFISTNITTVLVVRVLNRSARKALSIQIMPVVLCSVLSFALNRCFNILIAIDSIWLLLVKLILAGVIYSLLIALVVWKRPSLVAMDRNQLIKLIKSKLKGLQNKL